MLPVGLPLLLLLLLLPLLLVGVLPVLLELLPPGPMVPIAAAAGSLAA
jgi:hypothetical protein